MTVDLVLIRWDQLEGLARKYLRIKVVMRKTEGWEKMRQ